VQKLVFVLAVALCSLLLAAGQRWGLFTFPGGPVGQAVAAPAEAPVEKLQAEIKKLEGLVPDQAAVMSHVGYHWSNLWFAIDQENWPLADFYLSEVRSNLKWAVRVKPVRIVNKEKVDLKSIAEALDNSQLTQMKTAIGKKDKKKSAALYEEALQGCYACHKASDKPYLRPRRPSAPEARVINFDPKATEPK
jgi:cytochrome c553